MKVKDIMTLNPYTITSDSIVEDTWNKMNKLKIRTLPVIEKEKLVGIITKYDLKKKAKSQNQTISKIMSVNPITVSPDDDAEKTSEKLMRARINSFLVVENDKLVGILTKYDVKKNKINIKKHRCQFCDGLYNYSEDKCPNCGAPMR